MWKFYIRRRQFEHGAATQMVFASNLVGGRATTEMVFYTNFSLTDVCPRWYRRQYPNLRSERDVLNVGLPDEVQVGILKCTDIEFMLNALTYNMLNVLT